MTKAKIRRFNFGLTNFTIQKTFSNKLGDYSPSLFIFYEAAKRSIALADRLSMEVFNSFSMSSVSSPKIIHLQ